MSRLSQLTLVPALLPLLLAMSALAEDAVTVVQAPPTKTANAFYVSNKAPLAPSPLVKLPIGSIRPDGLLRNLLEIEAAGMSGRLEEISPWCKFPDSAWVTKDGTGKNPWEEMPYWLKGYGDLGYVLQDDRIVPDARKWVEGILSSQREDGWFGPRALLTNLDGKIDFWPNMLALNILQSYYEYTGDKRVLPFMARYFKFQQGVPDKEFILGYWPHIRAGDNLESIYWLYNRTGEAWLLEVAKKVHEHTAKWSTGVINWHGVNVSQSFRQPAMYFMQALDPKFLQAAERNYDTVMGLYGQVPGGMFGADENARPGYTGPRQGAETCSMVEFMHSFEMLAKITGNPVWADRCEEVAYNSLPCALTADMKALHYLTCPNQVQLDHGNKAPGVQNGGEMFSYSPLASYRCCQHNVAHGWPYFAEECWLATADNGLCASLYTASQVEAKVGDGTTVKIFEQTDYPFSDTVTLRVVSPKSVRFPLYLRIPRWCQAAKVSLNGKALSVQSQPLSYVAIDRAWSDDDTVTLQMPMKLAVRDWKKNKDCVSVDRGPLTYSLKIGEKWQRYGGSDAWPTWDVYPTTPWNYGLELDPNDPTAGMEVSVKGGPLPRQPFTIDAAPIMITAKARKVPAWKQDANGLICEVQQSPAKTAEPVETVTLIPMGCARLRVSAFPTVSAGEDAHDWTSPPKAPTASHCHEGDTTTALNDGLIPKNSNDHDIPRFTWWPHKGTKEWVQYDFDKPRKLSQVEVYWFDDTGGGECRVPASWQVLYLDGNQWKPVANPGACGSEADKFNKTTFDAVETKGLRLEVQLKEGFSGGILEWKVQ